MLSGFPSGDSQMGFFAEIPLAALGVRSNPNAKSNRLICCCICRKPATRDEEFSRPRLIPSTWLCMCISCCRRLVEGQSRRVSVVAARFCGYFGLPQRVGRLFASRSVLTILKRCAGAVDHVSTRVEEARCAPPYPDKTREPSRSESSQGP